MNKSFKILTSVFFRDAMLGLFYNAWALTSLKSGATFNDLAFNMAFFFLFTAVFQLPTGMFADYFGRKVSSLLGALITCGGFLLALYGVNGFEGIIVFSIIGMGITFISGAMDAWLLSTYSENEKGKNYFIDAEITGRIATISTLVFGGFLLNDFKGNSIWWLLLSCGLLLIISILGLEEKKSINNKLSKSTYKKPSIVSLLKIPGMILILSSSFLFGSESGLRAVIHQPFYIDNFKGNYQNVTYFLASLSVMRLIGGFLLRKISKNIKSPENTFLLWIGPFLLGISEVLYGINFNFTFSATLFLVSIIFLGWFFPLRSIWASNHFSEEKKATLFSLDSKVRDLASCFACLTVGVFLQNPDFKIWFPGGIFLIFMAGLFIIIQKNN